MVRPAGNGAEQRAEEVEFSIREDGKNVEVNTNQRRDEGLNMGCLTYGTPIQKGRQATLSSNGKPAPSDTHVSIDSISDSGKKVNGKFSQKETERYDYSKPFIQQVDDLLE